MNMCVRVLEVTYVMPPEQTTNRPRDRTTFKLSPFDTLILALPPSQVLFFYDGGSIPSFSSLVSSLRASLAATLAVFAPLAGKLTACSSNDDVVVIDFSPDAVRPGVMFVEAEYSGDSADMRKLAQDVEHDTEAFLQLVPELEIGMLPAPVLAVQVTRPTDQGEGAVVVGVSVHHAMADGKSLLQFMRAWAAALREGSPTAAGLVPPLFDKTRILQHPKAEAVAHKFTRAFAPDLPKVNMLPEPDWTQQSRRTYMLSAGHIQALRRCIRESQAADGNEQSPEPPTTYVALASLLWTSIAFAKFGDHPANAADHVYFQFPADCRSRMCPPLDPGFFGNCVKIYYARATAGEICGVHALARAAAAVGRVIREHVEDQDLLGNADRWLEMHSHTKHDRLAMQVSSHRFMFYEVDFGWGQPSRVELVSVYSKDMVTLVGARNGAVQVSVALDRECINDFEARFMSQVSACMIKCRM